MEKIRGCPGSVLTGLFGLIFKLGFQLSWSRIHLQCRRPRFDAWVRKIRCRRDRLPTPVFLGFPCGSTGKESSCHAGALGSIPGLGRSPGERKGYPLQYSGLENSMDGIIHEVAKSWTWLCDCHFTSLHRLILLLAPIKKSKLSRLFQGRVLLMLTWMCPVCVYACTVIQSCTALVTTWAVTC